MLLMKGFSLFEIIMALAIFSILSLASFSSYTFWYQNMLLQQAAAEITTSLDFTKTLSIDSGNTVYLCASTDQQTCNANWQGSLLIFTSDTPNKIETIMRTFKPVAPGIIVSFTEFKQLPLYFTSDGETANNGSFSVDNGHQHLSFSVSRTGIVHQDISS